MRVPTPKPLLGRVHPDKFIGRERELERLYLRALASDTNAALQVSSAAGAGVSELLRQLYDRLFTEQRFVVPFYFSLRAEDGSAHAAAARYQYQFLLQAVAFRRRDPGLIAAAPDICELSKLAPIQDAEWVTKMCEACRIEGPLNDERAFIRTALNAPFRASAAANFRVLVIVDDLHESMLLQNGDTFRDGLFSIAERAKAPILLASRSGAIETALEILEIKLLGRRELAELAHLMAVDSNVTVTDETLDLIAAQFPGKPGLIELFIQAARSQNKALATYKDVEKLYSDELLNGRLGMRYDDVFSRAVPDTVVRQKVYNELYFTIGESNEDFPISALRERLAIGKDTDRIVETLVLDEIIQVKSAYVRVRQDPVLIDFLTARHRPTASRRATATIAALTVTNALKRAPKIMSRIYRREAALGLTDILLLFDVQEVPRSLLDYRIFRDEFKGLTETQARERLSAGGRTVELPQIAHAAPIVDHLPEFESPAEPERAVVGVGFKDRGYSEDDEVTWLAAEIDSKLEADAALTQEWCDRLNAAALEIGSANHRIWLVAPEGFSEGGLDILEESNGFGSSRRQAELLKGFLTGSEPDETSFTEYEMVIPIGEETELVAAHALEEIARKYGFPAKSVNQLKTALVEACINASEHSLAPDARIHLKFEISRETITITVSNRGMRMKDRAAETTSTKLGEGRRGWGIGLIRSLMDEVQVRPVDDGTRIVMTKYLRGTE